MVFYIVAINLCLRALFQNPGFRGCGGVSCQSYFRVQKMHLSIELLVSHSGIGLGSIQNHAKIKRRSRPGKASRPLLACCPGARLFSCGRDASIMLSTIRRLSYSEIRIISLVVQATPMQSSGLPQVQTLHGFLRRHGYLRACERRRLIKSAPIPRCCTCIYIQRYILCIIYMHIYMLYIYDIYFPIQYVYYTLHTW